MNPTGIHPEFPREKRLIAGKWAILDFLNNFPDDELLCPEHEIRMERLGELERAVQRVPVFDLILDRLETLLDQNAT